MVAPEQALHTVEAQGHRTVRALHLLAAISAEKERGIGTPVEEEDDLLVSTENLAHLLLERFGEN